MGDSDFSQCKLLGSSRENGNCAAPSKPSKPPIGGVGRNYINPFVHEVEVPNPLTKLKIIILTVCLVPIRIVCIAIFLLIAWMIACIGLYGVSLKELETKPLSKWRRALRRVAAISMRCLYFAGSFNFIKFKGTKASAKEAPILCVAPHSSIFDSLVVLVLGPPSIVAKAETASILFFGKLINFTQPIYVWREDPDSRQTTIKNIVARANSEDDWPQILIFPEGTCANRRALITFKPGAFYPGVPVQPVCVRYPNEIDSYTWTWDGPGVARLLWLTLTKWHSFLEIEYLPVYTPNEEEKKNPKLFAQNVRDVMAKNLNIPISDYSYDDCVVMTKAKDMNIPYPADIIEIRRYRQKLGLDSTKYDINLLNTCNYWNINQWPDLAQFADYLHMSVNNNENLKSLYSLFTHSDDSKHISFTAYLLCALFLAREDEESILDFLKVVSKLYQDAEGYLTKEGFRSVLLHSGKLSKGASVVLISHFFKNDADRIKFDQFSEYVKQNPKYQSLCMPNETYRRRKKD